VAINGEMTENMEVRGGGSVDLVRDVSLAERVRKAIEQQIVSGLLVSGDKLNEADWAERLAVSRGPVREAFRALEQAGLVRTEKHRGVFVRSVSLAEADEIYAVRLMLEEAACRLLADRVDAVRVARMRATVDAMRDALDVRDREAYARANVEFHLAIVAGAGNGKLFGMYRQLVGELSLFRRAALAVHEDAMEQSLAEHRAILTAIASRDAERAVKLLREHVEGGRRRVHQAYVGVATA
jgi:phosphonate utilization transcriptional regulator